MGSDRTRRVIIVLILLSIILFSSNKLSSLFPIKLLNNKLLKYNAWKIALIGYTFHYLLSHSLTIFGLGPSDLPEHHYHPDFAKVRRVFTGLDAGIITSIHVQPKCFRDILSIILGAYFIAFPKLAEDRMHRFHQDATLEGIRACWQKGRHPLLWAITRLKQPIQIAIHRKLILIDPLKYINSNTNTISDEFIAPIHAYLYFQGTESELRSCKHVVINYPGGGFVAMDHTHHESYINKWSNYLMKKCVIVSVDYRKAPEHKYPCGFNDAYYCYFSIAQTNGKCIGINDMNEAIKIALSGDSAGGNFVGAVCCRAIVEKIKIPDGLLMAYPVLDLNMNIYRALNDVIDYPKRNMTNCIARYSLLPQDIDIRDDALSTHGNVLQKYVETPMIEGILRNAQKELTHNTNNDNSYRAFAKPTFDDIENANGGGGPLTSRAQYFDDGVLPIKYLFVLGDMYLPTNADPVNDMYLSPIVASIDILKQFPMTRIHVGSIDPLSDDSRRFCKILKYANADIDVKLLEWDGISHAYIQCPTFLLPQARFSCELSVHWLSMMLDINVTDRQSFQFDYQKINKNKNKNDKNQDFANLNSRL